MKCDVLVTSFCRLSVRNYVVIFEGSLSLMSFKKGGHAPLQVILTLARRTTRIPRCVHVRHFAVVPKSANGTLFTQSFQVSGLMVLHANAPLPIPVA